MFQAIWNSLEGYYFFVEKIIVWVDRKFMPVWPLSFPSWNIPIAQKLLIPLVINLGNIFFQFCKVLFSSFQIFRNKNDWWIFCEYWVKYVDMCFPKIPGKICRQPGPEQRKIEKVSFYWRELWGPTTSFFAAYNHFLSQRV